MSSGQPLADAPDFFAHRHRHSLPNAALAGVVVVGAVVAAVVLVVLVVVLYRRFAGGRTAPTAPSTPTEAQEVGAPAKLQRFSYEQLRRATGYFSPCLKLGQGGFGSVFRASLSSGIRAVKLLDSGSLQGEREFHNELALAASIISAPLSSGEEAIDRRLVVFPIGFCSEELRQRRRRWQRKPSSSADFSPGILEASACSGATAPGRRLLLVYELMHNGSLQAALLNRRCPELMDWGRRFAVILDVARGLQFLHTVCDPPVIHGDIKPSNILLDAEFSAKIGDFGLARVKPASDEMPAAAEEVVVEIRSDDNTDANDMKKEISLDRGEEDDASLMEGTAESTTTDTLLEEQDITPFSERSLEEDQHFPAALPTMAVPASMPSPSETGDGFDHESVDSGMGSKTSVGGWKRSQKKRRTVSSKDWWWRQDVGNRESVGNAEDYVMEWIRSEIKNEQPISDFAASPITLAEERLPKSSTSEREEGKWSHRRSDWWTLLDKKVKKREKTRPLPREWWREEFCEELTNKRKRRAMVNSKNSKDGGELIWWQKDDDLMLHVDKRRGKKKCHSSIDWWNDSIRWEIKSSIRKSSQDHASCCDVPRSGTVSSTPSMRGTICYVAPEYGGGESLSEKCDIYSFGVLLLVIVAGRRPLQVIASPMSEFERANLISWARQLARMGCLLDLLDPSLCDVCRNFSGEVRRRSSPENREKM